MILIATLRTKIPEIRVLENKKKGRSLARVSGVNIFTRGREFPSHGCHLCVSDIIFDTLILRSSWFFNKV